MRRFQRKLLVPVSVFRTRVGTFRARTGAASGSRWSGLKRSGWCSGSGSIHDLQAGEGFCFWNENMEIFCKSRWWIAKNLTYLLTKSYFFRVIRPSFLSIGDKEDHFFKKANPGLFFNYFTSFLNKQFFYIKLMWNNVLSNQYMPPEFEPTTSRTWVVSHNH